MKVNTNILLIIGILIIMFLSSLHQPLKTINNPQLIISTQNKNYNQYEKHTPILILNDTGFTVDNGIIQGNGTQENPYVIEKWEINSNLTTGIIIKGTNASVIIRSCFIYGNNYSNTNGICLENVTNCIMFNNSITDTSCGIFIVNSSNCVISNNILSKNHDGIYPRYTNNVSILSNEITNNDRGIILQPSNNNIIFNNSVLSSKLCGILLWFSDNNNISNNRIIRNGDGMFLVFSKKNIIFANLIKDNIKTGINITNINSVTSCNRIYYNSFLYNNGANSIYDPAHIQAYDDDNTNFWNSSNEGNYWSDWTYPDDNFDGIVDNPYVLGGNPNPSDFLPLTSSLYVHDYFYPLPFLPIIFLLIVTRKKNIS